MEQLLHYAWKHKIYPLSGLTTTEGLPIEVINPGMPNHNAGPDFFNAKIKIDGTLWAGNVELHLSSSDWKRHGHHNDKSYDSVILHLVAQADCEVFRTNGETIPQAVFTCPDSVRARYEELKEADNHPPCIGILSSLPTLTVHSWFTALQVERLEQKTRLIMSRLERYNNHWEDVFFITLSRNFGFGVNGDAFEMWANALPFRALDKHRDNLLQVEAICFGQAGLLDQEVDDSYYRDLQKEYRYLSHKFELTPMDASQWRFLRLRPDNFPYVRLAQLARLYSREYSLFSRIIEAQTLKELKEIFTIGTSEYWNTHFNFTKTSDHREKKLGAKSLDLLAINTVVPFLYAYGLHKTDEALCNRALAFLEEIKAEHNYITRLWDGAGLPVHTAADSQALIQLQKEYCDAKKCLYCRFGHEYLRCK